MKLWICACRTGFRDAVETPSHSEPLRITFPVLLLMCSRQPPLQSSACHAAVHKSVSFTSRAKQHCFPCRATDPRGSSSLFDNLDDQSTQPAPLTVWSGAGKPSQDALAASPYSAGSAITDGATPSEGGNGVGYSGQPGYDPTAYGSPGSVDDWAVPDDGRDWDSPQWQGFYTRNSGSSETGNTYSYSAQAPFERPDVSSGPDYETYPGSPPGWNDGAPRPGSASDITLLTEREADIILPLGPTGRQADYYRPRTLPERVVQIAGSIGVSAVLSKSAILAGPALLFPVWGPWVQAGARNLEMYAKQFRNVGLWRAQVLQIDFFRAPYSRYTQTDVSDTVSLTIGDPTPTGARVELAFPLRPGCEQVRLGDAAELLVLCSDPYFQQFKVVREVYCPASAVWLADYPFMNRDMFLRLSIEIEEQRRAVGTPLQQQPPPGLET